MLWEVIQDESRLPNPLVKLCLTALGELFASFPRIPKAEKEKYLIECFDKFKSSESVPQSLILSLHIFVSLQTNSLYGKGTTRKALPFHC